MKADLDARRGDASGYYAPAEDYETDPLINHRFPDGGALAVLVRDLELRARGKRHADCAAEAARPHFDYGKQYCGAVPVAQEVSKLRANLGRTRDDQPAKRQRLEAMIDAYEKGRIF